jgi:hypothetical protein
MDRLTKNDIKDLMGRRNFLCVSLYMPTYRSAPEAKQNSIRFKNLLKKMEQRLISGGFKKSAAKVLSEYGKALVRDNLFWQYQSDGFAAFLSSQWFRYYRLPASFEELLVITDRYHIKPLLPVIANDVRFYVLALSQNEVKFLQCSRYSFTEVKLDEVPGSLGEALKLDEPEKHLQFHTKTPGSTRDRAAIFHGQGAGKDSVRNNILRFFQQIDRGLQKILREDPAPLVLAGVDYLLPIYREASSAPSLMEEGIRGNPEGVKSEELHREAWTIMEPHFLKVRNEAAARYKELAGGENASRDVEKIAVAAFQGRVDSLFFAVGMQLWGTFDPAGFAVDLHATYRQGDEDLMDFSAMHTLLKGGTVHALKQQEMPDRASLAAILRY